MAKTKKITAWLTVTRIHKFNLLDVSLSVQSREQPTTVITLLQYNRLWGSGILPSKLQGVALGTGGRAPAGVSASLTVGAGRLQRPPLDWVHDGVDAPAELVAGSG